MKKFFKIITAVILIFPIAFYIGIVVVNNSIANGIENNLLEYDLPQNTQLVDSISIASKLVGSGNGMQYMGSILVESDLTKDELYEHYSNEFDYIEVNEQTTNKLEFIDIGNYYFNKFDEEGTYYSVTCWDYDVIGRFGENIATILDMDIRGH